MYLWIDKTLTSLVFFPLFSLSTRQALGSSGGTLNAHAQLSFNVSCTPDPMLVVSDEDIVESLPPPPGDTVDTGAILTLEMTQPPQPREVVFVEKEGRRARCVHSSAFLPTPWSALSLSLSVLADGSGFVAKKSSSTPLPLEGSFLTLQWGQGITSTKFALVMCHIAHDFTLTYQVPWQGEEAL